MTEPTEQEKRVAEVIMNQLSSHSVIDESSDLLLREARAAIAECYRWRPIETAPKDGQILAFVPSYHQGKGGMIIALWCDWPGGVSGWYDNRAWPVTPTHRLPLPPPTGDEG